MGTGGDDPWTRFGVFVMLVAPRAIIGPLGVARQFVIAEVDVLLEPVDLNREHLPAE